MTGEIACQERVDLRLRLDDAAYAAKVRAFAAHATQLWVANGGVSRVNPEAAWARTADIDAAPLVYYLSNLIAQPLAETLAIVGDNGGALSLSLAAGSFRDGTRVAGSAPSLVRAMCETNHAALLEALDEALSLLNDARAHLSEPKPSLEELVDNGYRSRIRFEARSGLNAAQSVSPTPVSNRPVFRLHPGVNGWINQLIQAESVGARIEVL